MVGGGELALPVERAHVAEGLDAYAPGAWATALEDVIERVSPDGRGRARHEQGQRGARPRGRPPRPAVRGQLHRRRRGRRDPRPLGRQPPGGGAHPLGRSPLLSVAPHAVAAAEGDGSPELETFTPAFSEADLARAGGGARGGGRHRHLARRGQGGGERGPRRGLGGRASGSWRSWRGCSTRRWAARGWSRAPAGARTPTRWGRPARRWRPTSTSPAASAAPRSTSRAARARRRSSRSTPTPRRRSSRAPTTP